MKRRTWFDLTDRESALREQAWNTKKHYRSYESPYLVKRCHVDSGQVKTRQAIFREFWKWYVQNHAFFPFPINVTSNFDDQITFTMDGINPHLIGRFLKRGEIEIWWEENGRYHDNVTNFWADPCFIKHDVYTDQSLLEEFRTPEPSREVIWRKGIFEPFLRWQKETLGEATWIRKTGERSYEHQGVDWDGVVLITDSERPEDTSDNGYLTQHEPVRLNGRPEWLSHT
jgi:hypothetical protein